MIRRIAGRIAGHRLDVRREGRAGRKRSHVNVAVGARGEPQHRRVDVEDRDDPKDKGPPELFGHVRVAEVVLRREEKEVAAQVAFLRLAVALDAGRKVVRVQAAPEGVDLDVHLQFADVEHPV